MKLAAVITLVLAAVVGVLWFLFVVAPPAHEVCQHKSDILVAEAGGAHDDAVANLLDQYRLSCRKQADKTLQLRGKVAYARWAKCVMGSKTLSEAERCG